MRLFELDCGQQPGLELDPKIRSSPRSKLSSQVAPETLPAIQVSSPCCHIGPPCITHPSLGKQLDNDSSSHFYSIHKPITGIKDNTWIGKSRQLLRHISILEAEVTVRRVCRTQEPVTTVYPCPPPRQPARPPPPSQWRPSPTQQPLLSPSWSQPPAEVTVRLAGHKNLLLLFNNPSIRILGVNKQLDLIRLIISCISPNFNRQYVLGN